MTDLRHIGTDLSPALPLAGVLGLLPFPAAAQAFDLRQEDTLALAIFVVLLTILIFLPIILWLRSQLRQALDEANRFDIDRSRLNEILASAPDGFFRWDLGPDGSVQSENCSRRLAVLLGLFGGTNATFADILENFGPEAATALTSAVDGLHRQGNRFELELALKEGSRRIQVVGSRAANPEGTPLADVLWMRDVTEGATEVEILSHQRHDLGTERDRLRSLLDALPKPVWMRDDDLSLVDCNQAYARAVDAASPEDAVSAGTELIPASAVREARALAARARASGLPRSEQFHLVMEGARRLVELTEVPFHSALSSGLLTAGIAIDRTREEDLQAEIGRHVAAQAEVLENLGTAIAVFSADTHLSFFNTAYSMLWQLDADWLGTEPTYGNLLDVLREQRRLPEVADYRAFKEEELRRFTSLLEAREDLLHLPDERTLRRVISAHPFGGLLFTYEDVTDALALERSHKTSLAVHRETLDNLHEGIAVFSSDGRLRLSNPAYGRIWNLSPEELDSEPHINDLVERHQRYFTTAADWPAVRSWMLAQSSDREARHGRIERSDGAILDYASVPLPDGAVLTTWLDVSDSARVERALRDRNDALAAADRLKSEFIANVSAEVRTPLTTILGFSEILSNGYFGALNPRQLEYTNGITEAGNYLLQVLSDILDLATIEAGQMTLSLNAVDVHAMLTGVLKLTRERLREKQLVLHFDCPLDIGWMVADERRVRQVLFSLLSNAVKFTPPHGQITLAAMRASVEGGEEILVTVADTGRGISAKEQQVVFGSFVRGSPENADKAGTNTVGAGLGLSLVKNFVELHGGWVELHSVPSEGTTFIIHLPAGRADPLKPQAPLVTLRKRGPIV
ncbi:ATP-binding protein [Telmatospirillum sp.]|uniref:sensor histidine kinase n=1 Tax=Telmatospirillum sp. TaxID=2079197 RepID=UPI00284B53BD|nr:ATP-binding protein [Telmatospirillum sp.]MDR3440376.1 PAS-domain containing protein [Telmatospirillum sp.]